MILSSNSTARCSATEDVSCTSWMSKGSFTDSSISSTRTLRLQSGLLSTRVWVRVEMSEESSTPWISQGVSRRASTTVSLRSTTTGCRWPPVFTRTTESEAGSPRLCSQYWMETTGWRGWLRASFLIPTASSPGFRFWYRRPVPQRLDVPETTKVRCAQKLIKLCGACFPLNYSGWLLKAQQNSVVPNRPFWTLWILLSSSLTYWLLNIWIAKPQPSC